MANPIDKVRIKFERRCQIIVLIVTSIANVSAPFMYSQEIHYLFNNI